MTTKPVRRGITSRLILTKEQEEICQTMADSGRFVFNQVKETADKEYKENKVTLSKYDMIKLLPAMVNEFPFLKGTYSQCRQQAVIDFYESRQRFLDSFKAKNVKTTTNGKKKIRKVGPPKFRKKRFTNTFRFPQNVFKTETGIKVPALGVLKLCGGKKRLDYIKGEIKQVTIHKESDGYWYIGISLISNARQYENNNNVIGIDLGIKASITTSDGEQFNLEGIEKLEKKLKKVQRKLSRQRHINTLNEKKIAKLEKSLKATTNRVKRGILLKSLKKLPNLKWSNYNKTKEKLQKLHARVKNKRKDFHHKMSFKLVNENQVIGLETLNLLGMVKNKRLARAISRQAWGQFIRFVGYKAEWRGRTAIKMDSFFASSKICSVCGHKNCDLELKDRSWTCPKCKTLHERDGNAARNIQLNSLYAVSNDNVPLNSEEYSAQRAISFRNAARRNAGQCLPRECKSTRKSSNYR